MHDHFKKENKQNITGAIKLGSDKRKDLKKCIMTYAFQIKKEYKRLYEMICGLTEKYLHDHLDFLLGNK